jgi:hypothetical protein
MPDAGHMAMLILVAEDLDDAREALTLLLQTKGMTCSKRRMESKLPT